MKLVHLSEITEVGINNAHDVKKKTMLERGYIPKLMMFGQATFKVSQKVEEHSHETMYEVYFIQQGKAVFVINGKEYEVNENDCITIEPKELHFQKNPYTEPVTWLYFGIATD